MKTVIIASLAIACVSLSSCGTSNLTAQQQGNLVNQVAAAGLTNSLAKKNPAAAYQLATAQAQQNAAAQQQNATQQQAPVNQAAGLLQTANGLRGLLGR